MSLPYHRHIATGRTYASRWDALDYACPVKGYRPQLRLAPALAFAVAAVVLLIVATVLR